jgi:hypothetical protein
MIRGVHEGGDHDMCFPFTGSEDGRDQLYIRLAMNGGHELPIEMLLGIHKCMTTI